MSLEFACNVVPGLMPQSRGGGGGGSFGVNPSPRAHTILGHAVVAVLVAGGCAQRPLRPCRQAMEEKITKLEAAPRHPYLGVRRLNEVHFAWFMTAAQSLQVHLMTD